MELIKYDYLWVYFKDDKIIKRVQCTAKETQEAGEIMLKDFGADRVIKINKQV